MELFEKIKYLFDRDCDEEMTEEEEDAIQKVADDLVAEYGWDEVFSETDQYLRRFCTSPETVINFAVLFWNYMWYENPLPDPYRFLAYFYYRINWQTALYDDRDILAVPDLPADLEAVHSRKHQVEDDQVVVPFQRGF